MPTPFTHLTLAEEMLRRHDLSIATRRHLTQQRGPFLLGHTAPDVKTVSGQRREACHFYTVPRTSDRPACDALFDAYPSLAHGDALPKPQAAFVAGYVAHLVVDEVWLDDVFRHYFLQDWAPLRERLFLHNVLRTWLDSRDQAKLNGKVVQALREVEPHEWLPFVDDGHLRAWRDWLVEQLSSAQRMQTAEVFARRMGIPAEEVQAVAQSPNQMEERVFRYFPRSALASFRETVYRRTITLVGSYMGRLADR
ncbi:MAG: zinc dependent phospholipase C family protein [Anaerolineae bacterium]|jgi:hypothetical protein